MCKMCEKKSNYIHTENKELLFCITMYHNSLEFFQYLIAYSTKVWGYLSQMALIHTQGSIFLALNWEKKK